MESLAKTKARLDQLYETFGPAHATDDPIWLPRRYVRAEDREIVAFVVAALAYGRLAQIRRSAEVVLSYLGERPAMAVRRLHPQRAATDLRGFRHRFNSGREVALMLHILGRLLSEYGSIRAAFMSGYDPSRENVGPALSAFSRLALSVEIPRLDPARRGSSRTGVRWFFSSPEDGSACKRQNMFLRWMVRCGGVDLGLWRGILPSKLVMPLDTHVARISRRLGFSRRRSADWRMALEVTDALRRFDPDDPVRYDYALYNWDLSSGGALCATR